MLNENLSHESGNASTMHICLLQCLVTCEGHYVILWAILKKSVKQSDFSDSSAQVNKCLECLIVQVPFELSNFSDQVTFECPCAIRVHKGPLNPFWVKKKVCNIDGNGLFNGSVEYFKNFLEYLFCITVVVHCLLRNKMCKF